MRSLPSFSTIKRPRNTHFRSCAAVVFGVKGTAQHAINHAAPCLCGSIIRRRERYNKISNRGNLTSKENCDAGSQLLCYLDNITTLIAITFKTYFYSFKYSAKMPMNLVETVLAFDNNYCTCTKKRLLPEALSHYFP